MILPGPFDAIWVFAAYLIAGLFVARGGLRFRQWAVRGRTGIPRYSPLVETILLWIVYAVAVSIVLTLTRQVAYWA